MFVFRKIWRALFYRNTRFEIRSFALLPTTYYTTTRIFNPLMYNVSNHETVIRTGITCNKISC